jgi:hypothetical protein
MLFPEFERIDTSPKQNGESDYAFLNRSARIEIARVRYFVEQLWADYPAEEQEELESRIQSGSDQHFRSATFELILWAFLVRSGFDVQIHPELPGKRGKRPDFLISKQDDRLGYVEAVLASELGGDSPEEAKRKGVALDILAGVEHSDFFVDVQSTGHTRTQPSGRRLKASVLNWLQHIDHDDALVKMEAGEYELLPVHHWKHDAWKIRFRAIPKRKRGAPGRLVAAITGGVRSINMWQPLRNAVTNKGNKYGKLDLPLVIAVNVDAFNVEEIDILQALYGQEEIVYYHATGETKYERKPNGAWTSPSGPRYTRIGGVWVFNNLSPYTVAVRNQRIYLNPWTDKPVPSAFHVFPLARVDDTDSLVRGDGISLRSSFGLSELWPEDD